MASSGSAHRVRELAGDSARHLILVSATPHSGLEESFRSLLGLLNPAFDTEHDALDRRTLIKHLVQRRRADLAQWLGTETPFPERVAEERSYPLSYAYQSLYRAVLDYCRESIESTSDLQRRHQRVRHWAAIALLRCVLSSPAAAIAVLSERAKRQGVEDGHRHQRTRLQGAGRVLCRCVWLHTRQATCGRRRA